MRESERWHVGEARDGRAPILDANRLVVADVVVGTQHENLSDAHLMAAAPELFDALDALYNRQPGAREKAEELLEALLAVGANRE